MKQALRLLIIDDSPDDVELVRSSLSSQGYRVESTAVDTPMAMRTALNRQEWDLITGGVSALIEHLSFSVIRTP